MPKKIDLTNQIFGDWTVIREATPEEKQFKPGAYWLCCCKCGTKKIMNGQLLRTGASKSCGCGAAERIRQKNYQRAEDLIGQKFGKLTVIERVINSDYKGHQTLWKCQCECGNTTIVGKDDLKQQKVKSCGCLRKQIAAKQLSEISSNNFINEVGNRYGKLIVLYKVENNNKKGILWHCLCDCGNEKDISGDALRSGNTKSCGCLGRSAGEWKIENLLSQNNIQFSREFQQKINNQNMRYDFGIFNNNQLIYLIEYDGEQHFKSNKHFGGEEYLKYIQEHDAIKNQWCKNNNIPLIRIPYTHYNNLCIDDLKLETSKFILV